MSLKADSFYETLISDWNLFRQQMPWEGTWRNWTDWMLAYFFDKGKSLGFEAETKRLPSGDKGEGGYIVDLCWWKVEEKLYWLELALESEWSSGIDEIDHDFYKLIDIKAYLKIWLCSWGDRQIENRRKKLCNAVAQAKFKIPGEEYLILNMPTTEKDEYKDCLRVNAFWIDSEGRSQQLRPIDIYRER